ncbi:uncharacterized protein LOC124373526 isoform X2 [Homalodisca vitripennis]|nr:uncharacterized protein LOC124373526 isoform X2 [Homalodisca vitripennis]
MDDPERILGCRPLVCHIYTLEVIFISFCGLPSLLCGTLFYFTPESPKFLLTRGKKGDTMKILQRVHSVNSGKLPHTFPCEWRLPLATRGDQSYSPVQGHT